MQNNDNSGNNNENRNKASEREEMDDVSLMCIEISEDNVLDTIQNPTFDLSNSSSDGIDTYNYFKGLSDEVIDDREIYDKIEGKNTYTG